MGNSCWSWRCYAGRGYCLTTRSKSIKVLVVGHIPIRRLHRTWPPIRMYPFRYRRIGAPTNAGNEQYLLAPLFQDLSTALTQFAKNVSTCSIDPGQSSGSALQNSPLLHFAYGYSESLGGPVGFAHCKNGRSSWISLIFSSSSTRSMRRDVDVSPMTGSMRSRAFAITWPRVKGVST